jgi:sortase A
MRERMRRTLGGVGRSLVTIGTLILLFVAYQLWGTGYFTAQAQDDLKTEFAQLRKTLATTSTSAPTTTAAPTTPSTKPPNKSDATVSGTNIPQFETGAAVGLIHMPWGSYAVIEGTGRQELKKGPAHYPATVFPGQLGNAAIAGHRTTYLHPFLDLDTMHVGTEFKVEMPWGTYTYRVTQEPFAVKPTDVGVVATLDPKKATLTLTACNPKYSARQRLVVQSELVVDKSPQPQRYVKPKPVSSSAQDLGTEENVSLREGLQGGGGNKGPAVIWGSLMALVGLLWWWLFRHWRHPLTWIAGLIPFVPVLIGFYVYLEQALPAGY